MGSSLTGDQTRSPALAGRFFITEPPGNPCGIFFFLVRKFFTPFLNEDPFVKIHRQNFHIFTCMRAKLLQSCLALCNPKDCSPQAPLSMRFSRWEDWSGLPCPSPGDLPNPGTELETLRSPELAGRCFASSATWEVPISPENWFFWLLEINDVFSLKYQNKQREICGLWLMRNGSCLHAFCSLLSVWGLFCFPICILPLLQFSDFNFFFF